MESKEVMPSAVRVYELANPDLVKAQETNLRGLLFDLLKVGPGQQGVSFHIGASSGWLYFEDLSFMRGETVRFGLPDNADEAKRAANSFLSKLGEALADHQRYPFMKEIAHVGLLPRYLRPVEATAIVGKNGFDPEHWLVRYEARLPVDRQGKVLAPVHGAQWDVRVGEQGRIVGFSSRWPPISAKHSYHSTTPFDPVSMSKDGHGHNHDSTESASPQLVYLVNGDGVPQFYLSPYHCFADGHHLRYASACVMSLDIQFLEQHTMDEMRIDAKVLGGSGDYSFHWGHYLLESIWDDGVVDHRLDSPSLRISPPCYAVVMLHVLDRKTGAYGYHSAQVVGHPQYTVEEAPFV